MGIVAWFRDLLGSPREGPFFEEPIRPERVPCHVAIIMDGNGRWASRRHLPVIAGHRAGTRALKETVKSALRAGVRQLTVYSFSTENWNRPPEEVDGLMGLLEEMIDSEVDELHEQGVRLSFIGRREALPPGLRAKLAESEGIAFNDLKPGFWANKYIEPAKKGRLLLYLEGKEFEPNRHFVRAEAAEVLYQTPIIQKKVNEFWDTGMVTEAGQYIKSTTPEAQPLTKPATSESR